jgi:uncharacterized lipoprotein YddW (UPF0748 family)
MRSRLRVCCLWLLTAILPCLAYPTHAQARRGELRGFWADGFNEGYKTPEQVDLLLQRLRQAHCNALFAQMRKGGDAYYASHYEPWAHDDPGHFDALADLIRKAHALTPPIAVHAWLNVCAVGGNRYHLPGHIATSHPEWLSLNTRLQPTDPEAIKIDPGNPDAADWTFRVFMDVVRHYDIDGIHLDFVRYSGKRRGYNLVNVARFYRRFPSARTASHGSPSPSPPKVQAATALARNAEQTPVPPVNGGAAPSFSPPPTPPTLPDPDDSDWKQWRRDQVTAFVRRLYAQAVAIKPQIVVSAALITWEGGPHSEEEWTRKSAAMNLVFQDWRSWLQEGILDLGCPMTYFQARHALQKAADWDAWITAHQYGRAAAPAVGCWENTIPETLTLLSLARRADAAGRRPYGVLLYSYAGTNESPPDAHGRHRELQLQPEFYAALGSPSRYAPTPPFPSDVPLPPMPWKQHPTRGHLKGRVLTPDLQPIDGALVEVRSADGHVWRRRTDGTGSYAFIDLPTEALSVKRSALSVKTERSVERSALSVKAGESVAQREGRSEGAGRARYAVQVTGPDGEAAKAQAVVTAGEVTTVCFTLGKSDITPLASISDLLKQPAFASATRPGTPLQTTATSPSSLIPHPSSLPKPPSSVRLDGLLVTLGTDTDPGNLFVVDRQGAGLRVRLAATPVAPFQPGDLVSVVGAPAIVEGEPVLDAATACLTDMAPMSALPSPVAVRARELTAGTVGAGMPARVRGTVTISNADGFVLEDGGVPIRVPLAGRKEFSIEATALDATSPPVGAQVQVTGIVSQGAEPGTKVTVRLLPRSGADVVMLSPPPFARSAWARWLTLLVALVVVTLLAAWVRRKRTTPASE